MQKNRSKNTISTDLFPKEANGTATGEKAKMQNTYSKKFGIL